MYNIVGVKHDSKGEITHFKLDDGSTVTKEEAVSMAKNKKINNVAIGVSKSGENYLRSIPDGNEDNNLDNLTETE